MFVSSIIDAEGCKLLKCIDCQHLQFVLHHDFVIACCSCISASKIALKSGKEDKCENIREAIVIRLKLVGLTSLCYHLRYCCSHQRTR